MTRKNRLFWFVFAVTLAVYCVMIFWSIPRISAQAGGLAVFDLRPGGYSFDDAKAFLAALSPEGAAFYANVQHKLDTAYPALLALTLGWAILRLAPARWGPWRWPLAATALPGMVFDYRENLDVDAMLELGPNGITPRIVEAASLDSQIKAATSSMSMAVLLILLGLWLFRRWRAVQKPV
ncbi:MAG: hypothetical protein CL534_24735 [Ahrensia sp.]|nr:hypothetical protein [Ahrensia sp.]